MLDPASSRIIVPVRNGGERWRQAADALGRYVPRRDMVIVVDSASSDGSDEVASYHGFRVIRIDVRNFNHGGTRQDAISNHCAEVPFAVFLTQDAVLESQSSLVALLGAFGDSKVGAAYGRQIPHARAHPMAAFANDMNYPPTSSTRSMDDATQMGIKVAYLSNSFAAYRLTALQQCGGFPTNLILGEDTCVAMRMLSSGWRIRYCAEASVFHSHNYTLKEEFERFFDYGVLHTQCPELIRIGSPRATGLRLLYSEFKNIAGRRPWLLPELFARSCLKYAGYALGRRYNQLPLRACRLLSMTKGHWT